MVEVGGLATYLNRLVNVRSIVHVVQNTDSEQKKNNGEKRFTVEQRLIRIGETNNEKIRILREFIY